MGIDDGVGGWVWVGVVASARWGGEEWLNCLKNDL